VTKVLSKKGIVVGQFVQPVKQARAKQFRHRMTVAEALLWSRIRSNQLDGIHWRRQQMIDGLIVDFYCHAAYVIVEVDGPVHELQTEYDSVRDRILASRHMLVVRFSNDDVISNLEGVLAKMSVICQERIRRAP
jgi:very-short-patch-repair endonuclease